MFMVLRQGLIYSFSCFELEAILLSQSEWWAHRFVSYVLLLWGLCWHSVSSLDNSTRWTPQVSKLKQTDALKVTTPYMVMVAVGLNRLTPQEVGTVPISPRSFEKVPYMPKATKPVSVVGETDGNFHPRALGWWLPGGGLEWCV